MHAGSFAMSLQLFVLNLGKIHKVSASWKLHIPPLYPEESALFSIIIFTQNFYVFGHKTSIFPSSWSSL